MSKSIINTVVRNRWLLSGSAIFSGLIIGALITFTTMRTTKTVALAFTLALCFPFVIAIYRNIKHIFLAGLIICLPITIDMTINPSDHIGGATGYVVSAFDIFLAGLYTLWLFDILLKRKGDMKFHFSISLPGLALIIAAFMSMFNARYIEFSVYETIEIIKMFFAFFYLANNLKTKEEVNIVLLVLLFSLFLEGALSILQRRLGDPLWPSALGGPHFIRNDRVSGTWVSTNDFSWCMTFLLPVAISLLFSNIRAYFKYILLFIIMVGTVGLLYSKSRAAMIALPAVAIFVSVFAFGKIREKKKIVNLFFAIMALALFSSPLYPKIWHSATKRFVGDDGGSADSRWPQFVVAWKIIKDHPVAGIGVNNYVEIMAEYDTAASAWALDEITRFPVHNIFLGIAAEMGTVGIVVFFWFITSIFNQGVACIRTTDHYHHFAVIGLLGGILAFLIHGLVDAALIGNKLYMFIWVYAGIIVAIKDISYKSYALDSAIQ